jgi:hypothetical protein
MPARVNSVMVIALSSEEFLMVAMTWLISGSREIFPAWGKTILAIS